MTARRKSKGAYMISAVAEMYEIHPQTLRLYEREGLLKPSRTEGNTRLYSEEDLEVLMMLASQVAIIIEKVELHEQLIEKKRLEGQLEVARQVQLELLPAPTTKMTSTSLLNSRRAIWRFCVA